MPWETAPKMPWETPSQPNEMEGNPPLQPGQMQPPWEGIPEAYTDPLDVPPINFNMGNSAPGHFSWGIPEEQPALDIPNYPAQTGYSGYLGAPFEDPGRPWPSFDTGHHPVTNSGPYLYEESRPENRQVELPLPNISEQFGPEASGQGITKPHSLAYSEACVENTQPETLSSDEGNENALQLSTQSTPDSEEGSCDSGQQENPSPGEGNKSSLQLLMEGRRPESAEKGWPYAVFDEDHRTILVVYDPEDLEESDEDDNNEAYRLDWGELHKSPIWSGIAGARILMSPKARDVNIIPYDGFSRRYQRWINVPKEGQSNPARVLAVAPSPKQIGCTVGRNDVYCCFFVNHQDDHVIFRNLSDRELSLTQLSIGDSSSIPQLGETLLHAGLWALSIGSESVLELEVLKRKPFLIAPSSVSKRAAPTEERQRKRRRQLDEQAVHNERSELQAEDTICVDGTYRLRLLNTISDHVDSCAWLGEYSDAIGTKSVLVKVIKSKGCSTAEAAKFFQRAVSVYSALNEHPGTLKLLGADARSSSLHFEYTDAKPLSDQFRAGLSFGGSHADVVKIMKDMASALSWAHSKGILHADIKPANVLYSASRGAVLNNFSLNPQAGNASGPSGTPWYLPPEITRGWEEHSIASDVWAFGITGLWLHGHIPLPDKCCKDWDIRDIHPPGTPSETERDAIDRMSDWLEYIEETRSKLRQNDKLEGIIYMALEPNHGARIDAASLCKKFDDLEIDGAKASRIQL
ncbi:kinase-like domain-containing protein [Nemania sp. NC0429]|nr:kinase-like domain-containing protein [Nemania sp. NC0429]